jgi:Tfp pilus assembly protein PilZ
MSDAANEKTRGGKRGAPRQKWRAQVRFWNEHFEAVGFTADISSTGVLVETTRHLEVGTRLHIEIKVGDRSFFSEATVTRRRSSPPYAHSFFKPAVGMRFVGLVEAVQNLKKEQPDAFLEAAEYAESLERAAEADLEPEPAPDPAPAPEQAAPSPSLIDETTTVVDLRDRQHLRFLYERDLCRGGLLVEPAQPVALGDRIRVVLRLPEGNGDIPVRGHVVSTFSNSREVGVILDEQKQIRSRLLEILEAFEVG